MALMSSWEKLFQWLKLLFILALGIVTGVNLSHSIKTIIETKNKRDAHPFVFIGDKFLGLDKVLRNMKYVGYYTDKDLDVNQNAAEFAQAQYVLAPTILDLNNTNHPYIIFNCSTPEAAITKIKEIKAIPLKRKLDLILAKRPMTPNAPLSSISGEELNNISNSLISQP